MECNPSIQNRSVRSLDDRLDSVMGQDFCRNFESPKVREVESETASIMSMRDDNSDSMFNRFEQNQNCEVNGQQYKRLLFDTIRDHCPSDIRDTVYKDVMNKIKNPETMIGNDSMEYNTMNRAEFILLEQQAKKNKLARIKRINNMIKMFIHALDWFTRMMKVEWFNFHDFKIMVEKSIEEGEFNDCANGIEEITPNQILDNPFVGIVTSLTTKACKAQHMKEENSQIKMEKEQEERNRIRRSVVDDMRNARRNACKIGGIFEPNMSSNSDKKDCNESTPQTIKETLRIDRKSVV